jgi:sugar-specific transcriptional regulator TrmB
VPGIPPRDPKEQLKENQKNLRHDADQLLELAQQLKAEADKTEQTEVLSMPLVRKAEEVEKLARKVKDLARAI